MTYNAYARESSINQDYKYNGKELQDELNLGWLDYGARMYDNTIGRFFTLDRFSEKYYPISGYQYTANNPINNIDVNGDSVWVGSGKKEYLYTTAADGTTSLVDRKGNTYNKTNKKGELKGYLGKAKRALDKLKEGETGNKIVTGLEKDNENLVIKRGDNGFTTKGSERTLNWRPGSKNGGLDVNGSTSRPSFIGLGHELAHAYDAMSDGKWDLTGTWFGSTPNMEKTSTHLENLMRTEYDLPLREYYTDTQNPAARILSPSGASLYFTMKYESSVEPQKYSEQIDIPYEY